MAEHATLETFFVLVLAALVVALWLRNRALVQANRRLEAERGNRAAAESALQQSRESLARAQAIAHMGNWDWDLESGDFTWSEEVYRIFGRSSLDSPPSLKAYLETFPPGEGEGFRLALEKARNHPDQPLRMERRVVRPDGTERTVREVAEVIAASGGRVRRMVGTIYDVTGRVRVELALRESEERFRSLAQSANAALISADDRGLVRFWNTGAERVFGYAEGEILGRSVEAIIPEHTLEAHRQGMERVRNSGDFRLAGRTKVMSGRHKDGGLIPVEISLATWTEGGQRHYSAIIRDITERRRLEREQERALQLRITLAALLETALEPLTLQTQLEVALAIIQTIPWLATPRQGAIFLADPGTGAMTLGAQLGLEEHLNAAGRSGEGLLRLIWGPAVENREIVFVDTGMERRGGLPRHGRYCVPILFHDHLLGALILFRGGREEDRNPREEIGVLHTVGHTLAGVIQRRRVEAELEQSALRLRETRLEIIHRLGRASEFRDNETGNHIVRMSHYAARLGQALGMSAEQCELILHAAPMHDVGKIGIPDTILRKPGRLTAEEYETMKRHTEIGAKMLFGNADEPLRTAHIMALTHHERWDGGGYPLGLQGEEIPLVGRICAIADVFDALTSPRPYKSGWTPEAALAEIVRLSGSHFDPHLVHLFKNIFPDILAIRSTYADSTEDEEPDNGSG
ncbi:MAG: PAS domain S-box protein [Magnetococcales bacterium]|nr:PAS domain S-box protein [Magnetococcales bacterium]